MLLRSSSWRRAWLPLENRLFRGPPLRLLLWRQNRVDLVVVLLAQRVSFCIPFLLSCLGIASVSVDVRDILFDDWLNLFLLSGC